MNENSSSDSSSSDENSDDSDYNNNSNIDELSANSRKKGKVLSQDTLTAILFCHQGLANEQIKFKNAKNQNKKYKFPGISSFTAKILRVGKNQVTKTVKYFTENNQLIQPAICGNKINHPTKIERSREIISLIREFINTKLINHEVCISADIKQMLTEIDIRYQNLSLRSIQRFLKITGFNYSQINGKRLIQERLDIKHKRFNYLISINNYRNEIPKPLLIYTDESYIHHHYHLQKSYNDPNNTPELKKHLKNKGLIINYSQIYINYYIIYLL